MGCIRVIWSASEVQVFSRMHHTWPQLHSSRVGGSRYAASSGARPSSLKLSTGIWGDPWPGISSDMIECKQKCLAYGAAECLLFQCGQRHFFHQTGVLGQG